MNDATTPERAAGPQGAPDAGQAEASYRVLARKYRPSTFDDLIGQEPVVVKSLERNYRKVPGLSGATILGVQYHLYIYWNQAQRESFCDWFLLPSLGLQLAAPARTRRAASLRVVLIAGIAGFTLWRIATRPEMRRVDVVGALGGGERGDPQGGRFGHCHVERARRRVAGGARDRPPGLLRRGRVR